MKIERLFKSIPFPYRVQTIAPYSLQFESTGSLFDQPNYRNLNKHFWESITSEGWSTCPAGFAVLAKKLPDNDNKLLIFHGLKVKPFWTQRGGTDGLSVVLDATRMNSYAANFLKEYETIRKELSKEIHSKTQELSTEGVHEIRSMNTSLYHIGFELQEMLLYEKQKLALAKNIVALSELISARIELFDLTASGIDTLPASAAAYTPVYKKFDKIIRCYIAYAAKREISFTLNGDSRGQAKGIDHFEMIPLIVIDNAVKYSPNGQSIRINFSEDDEHINVEVTSYGPKIKDDEKTSIFEREFRGEHAIKNGQAGSGIGLYFARRMLENIGASIIVKQENNPIKV